MSDNHYNSEGKEKPRDIVQISSEVVTASGAAMGLVRDLKSNYEDLKATFDVRQSEISNQLQIPEKLDSIEESVLQIESRMSVVEEEVKKISDQTRPLSFLERVKNSILDNILGYFIALLIGIIITLLGLGFLL